MSSGVATKSITRQLSVPPHGPRQHPRPYEEEKWASWSHITQSLVRLFVLPPTSRYHSLPPNSTVVTTTPVVGMGSATPQQAHVNVTSHLLLVSGAVRCATNATLRTTQARQANVCRPALWMTTAESVEALGTATMQPATATATRAQHCAMCRVRVSKGSVRVMGGVIRHRVLVRAPQALLAQVAMCVTLGTAATCATRPAPSTPPTVCHAAA